MGKRGSVIHRKKLFGGRETAEQVHQKHAFPRNAKCPCGRRPLVRALTFAESKDAFKQYPELMTMDPNAIGKILVQLKGNDGKPRPCLRLGIAYSCKECRPIMEHQLARLPSWVLVEINEGPGPEKLVTSG